MLEFKIKSFTLRLSFSFFALVALLTSFGGENARTALLCLGCAMLHECGHIAAMLWASVPPESLTFYAGGIMLPPRKLCCTKAESCLILLSGCAVNFACAGLCALTAGQNDLFFANTALGCFNLLPFGYSDGAQVIAEVTGREPPAVLRAAAAALLVMLCCLGAYMGRVPLSLTLTTAYIIVSGTMG